MSSRPHSPNEIAAREATRTVEARARKRVRELKDFYGHLAVYLVVNTFLVALNLWTSPESFWAIWPLLGWGIGLASHAVSVFGLFGIGSREWEDRKVRELMMQGEGLTAEQLRRTLREELPAAAPLDVERINRRLEHLEAIVTSKDWDALEGVPGLRTDEPARGEIDLGDESAEAAARLARRVR